jgi:hypothetical protein
MDSAEGASNAKDRMKGSVLGLVLTLSAFLILRTINPVLISPSLTPLGEVAGIFYTNDSETSPTPLENSDTSDILSQGYTKIVYKCAANAYSPALLIWEFPNPGLEAGNDLSQVKVVRKTCDDNEEDIPPGSFKMAFESSGVYFCFSGCADDYMCQGDMSGVNTTSSNNIGEPFAQNVRGVRIVNDDSNYYAVILHKEIGLENGGYCSLPIFTLGNETKCKDTSDYQNASSADIFTLNNTSTSSGNGVTLYSDPQGWNKGETAGKFDISAEDISNFAFNTHMDTMFYDYDGTNASPDDQEYCQTADDCLGSIKIKGNYLVGLYSTKACQDNTNCNEGEICFMDADGVGQCVGPNGQPNYYCQTFTKDVPNLDAEQFMSSNGLNNAYIFPTK